MPRSWPERLAKRVPRLVDSLNKLEDKGRTKDPQFGKMLKELAELCGQILVAREQAEAELHQAKTDTIFHRRRMEEDTAAFKKERAAFASEVEELRKRLDEGEADLRRRSQLVDRDRHALAEALERAGAAERKYIQFIEHMKKAPGL